MAPDRTGQTVVIFVAQRSGVDAEGYAQAAAAMAMLAAQQPGYCGIDHIADGALGVTLSYWANEASAITWRQHPEHAETREAGRGRWYDWYMLHVAEIGRSYSWTRP